MPRVCVLLLGLLALTPLHAAEPVVLDLWPDKPPTELVVKGKEADTSTAKSNQVAGKSVIRLGNISRATLTVYRPSKEKDTGTAIVVCPGGGYNILAWDLEGTEVCEWLCDLGITAALLKYRVPSSKQREIPLHDAQRAISLTRSKAKEWGLQPKRIGILGFSAGGHLSASTSLATKRSYPERDEVDKTSCRPDFTVLVYPAYLVDKERKVLAPEITVDKTSPPMFLAHAANDPVPAENSLVLATALKQAGVPVELHLYESGGHGFGMRKTEAPCTRWPQRCEEWLKRRGLLQRP